MRATSNGKRILSLIHISADGLIEVISLDESGHGKAIGDLPMGSHYVQDVYKRQERDSS